MVSRFLCVYLFFYFPLSSDDCMRHIPTFMIELHMLRRSRSRMRRIDHKMQRIKAFLSLWVRYFQSLLSRLQIQHNSSCFRARKKSCYREHRENIQFLDNSSFEESKIFFGSNILQTCEPENQEQSVTKAKEIQLEILYLSSCRLKEYVHSKHKIVYYAFYLHCTIYNLLKLYSSSDLEKIPYYVSF